MSHNSKTQPPPPLPLQPNNIPPSIAPNQQPTFQIPKLAAHVTVSQNEMGKQTYHYEPNGNQQPVHQIPNQQESQQCSGQPAITQQWIPVYGPSMDTNCHGEYYPPFAENGATVNHVFMRMNELERKLNLLLKKDDRELELKAENEQMILARMSNFESNLTSIAVSMARIASQNMGFQEKERASMGFSSRTPNPINVELTRTRNSSSQTSIGEPDPRPKLNVLSVKRDKEIMTEGTVSKVVAEGNSSVESETVVDERSNQASLVKVTATSVPAALEHSSNSTLSTTEFPALGNTAPQKKPKHLRDMPVRSGSMSQFTTSATLLPKSNVHTSKTLTLNDFLPNAGKQNDKKHEKLRPVINRQNTSRIPEAHISQALPSRNNGKQVARGSLSNRSVAVEATVSATVSQTPAKATVSQTPATRSNRKLKKSERTVVVQPFENKKVISKAGRNLQKVEENSQTKKCHTQNAETMLRAVTQKSILPPAPEVSNESVKSKEQIQRSEIRGCEVVTEEVGEVQGVLEALINEVVVQHEKVIESSGKDQAKLDKVNNRSASTIESHIECPPNEAPEVPSVSDEPVGLTRKQKKQMAKTAKKEWKRQKELVEKAEKQQFLEALLTFPLDAEIETRRTELEARMRYTEGMTAEQKKYAITTGLSSFLKINDHCEKFLSEYTSEQSFLRSVVLTGKMSSKWCRMQKMLMTRDKAKLKRFAKVQNPREYHRKRMDVYNDQNVSALVKFFLCMMATCDDDVTKWDAFVLAEAAEGAEESEIVQNDLDYMMLVLKNNLPE